MEKRIFEKLEKIDDAIGEINVILAEQAKDLKYHIKRSDQADAAIGVLRERSEIQFREVNDSIKPLQKHVNMVEGVMKFLGLLALVAGIWQVLK